MSGDATVTQVLPELDTGGEGDGGGRRLLTSEGTRPPGGPAGLTADGSRESDLLGLGLFLVALTAVISWTFRDNIWGRATFPWDFQGRMTAGPTWVAGSISNGDWPSWNPFQGSGAPMATDIGSGTYYPAHLLAGVLDVALDLRDQTLLQIGHVWLGGLGAFLLARRLGLRNWWAGAIGLMYPLFGGFLGGSSHMHHVRGFAFFPWLLWALKIDDEGRFTWRAASVPAIAYALASGAYPGQVPAFGLIAAAWVGVQLPRLQRRPIQIAVGALLGLGAIAAILTVLYPYLAADGDGLLHRPVPINGNRRASRALSFQEVVGLYLPGTFPEKSGLGVVSSAWVGVPVLAGAAVGVVLSPARRELHQAARVIRFILGFSIFLALAPRLPGVRAVVNGPLAQLYPSRFVFADYKAPIALCLITLAVLGFITLSERVQVAPQNPREALSPILATIAVLVMAVSLAFVAETTLTSTPRAFVLIGIAVVAVVWNAPRLPLAALVLCVLALFAADSFRMWNDMAYDPTKRPLNNWTSADNNDFLDRITVEKALPAKLSNSPATRPERILALDTTKPQGRPPEALAMIGAEYSMGSYGGHFIEARRTAYEDPAKVEFLSQPSGFVVLGCQSPCTTAPPLPAGIPTLNGGIQVTSYTPERIDYSVNLTGPVVVAENEMMFPGWSSTSTQATLLSTDSELRVWALDAGQYTFSARYQSPWRERQLVLLGAALLCTIGLGALTTTRRPQTIAPRPTTAIG